MIHMLRALTGNRQRAGQTARQQSWQSSARAQKKCSRQRKTAWQGPVGGLPLRRRPQPEGVTTETSKAEKNENASGNEKESIPNNWGPQKMSVQHHGNNGAGGVAEEIFETLMTETFPKLMSDHQSKRLRKH